MSENNDSLDQQEQKIRLDIEDLFQLTNGKVVVCVPFTDHIYAGKKIALFKDDAWFGEFIWLGRSHKSRQISDSFLFDAQFPLSKSDLKTHHWQIEFAVDSWH